MYYFELAGQFGNVATVFIVCASVLPNFADLLFEGFPAFQERRSCRWLPAFDAANCLLCAFQGYWTFNDLIVIYQSPRRQMNERRKYDLIPVIQLVITFVCHSLNLLIIRVFDYFSHDFFLRLLESVPIEAFICSLGILNRWCRACSTIVGG